MRYERFRNNRPRKRTRKELSSEYERVRQQTTGSPAVVDMAEEVKPPRPITMSPPPSAGWDGVERRGSTGSLVDHSTRVPPSGSGGIRRPPATTREIEEVAADLPPFDDPPSPLPRSWGLEDATPPEGSAVVPSGGRDD